MPRKNPTTIWLATIIIACLSGNLKARNFRYVIIDPGHGGYDLGGSHGKVYEKHLALDTAL